MAFDSPTPRTRVVRLPKRGDYSQKTIYEILDAAFLCHAGFVVDGQPYVIPTGVWPFGRYAVSAWLRGEPDAADAGGRC